ncbi:hypothetical protein BANRA_05140 [Klebsiella pneumoniae]|nr:hypothetical protein BANRA_05140 [Klebsiella pneumoniae]
MAGGHRDGEPERLQYGHENEIVVAASDNGRTSYQNAGKTPPRVELGWDQQFAPAWRAKLAWTLLDATYRENAGDAIQSGNRIPGLHVIAPMPPLAGCRKRMVRWR